MARSQRPLIAGLLGLLVVLMLTLALLVVTLLQARGASVAVTPTPTTAPTATPTPVLNISPAQGWVEVKPQLPFARTVAFATNDPLTGYACGSAATGSNAYNLQLSVTTNGGRTWQAARSLAFGKQYDSCALQVDPANAKDILIGLIFCNAMPCNDGDQEIPYIWYRSLDGGQTWKPLTYPPGVAAAPAHGFPLIDTFSWVGATLYISVFPFSQSGATYPIPNHLLVSKNGSDSVGFDTPQFYTALGVGTTDASIIGIVAYDMPFALGNGLALFYENTTTKQGGIITTSDGGQTWTHITPQFSGLSAQWSYIRVATVVGTTVYAIYHPGAQQNSIIIQSTDAAQTWTPLSAQPSGKFTSNTLLAAPDGTLFTATDDGSVVRLSAGANAWQIVVPLSKTTSSHFYETISWDTRGHPVALWGEIWHYTNSTDFFPSGFGLIYHAATAGS